MDDSNEPSKRPLEDGQLRETAFSYGLGLPVAPDWFSEEPKGSWEDGYQLSLQVIRDLKDRNRVFAERDACMVAAEFKM